MSASTSCGTGLSSPTADAGPKRSRATTTVSLKAGFNPFPLLAPKPVTIPQWDLCSIVVLLLHMLTLTHTKGEWKQQAGSEASHGERWRRQIIFPGDSSLIHQLKIKKTLTAKQVTSGTGGKNYLEALHLKSNLWAGVNLCYFQRYF